MDVKTYISSGILELYVSGQLSPEEVREVQLMMEQHPEVKQEVSSIEAAVAQFAEISFSATPSEGLLDQIMGEIRLEESPDSRQGRSLNSLPWRWIAVAAAVALLLSLAFNLVQYSRLQEISDRLFALEQQQNSLAEQLDKAAFERNILADPDNQVIDLNGLKLAPEGRARIVWNPQSARVYFLMAGMPDLTEAEQYQLWAIIDGKPVDAGLLKANGSLELAKPISGQVAAFAVTIEPRGGSLNPNLEKMVLYGEA